MADEGAGEVEAVVYRCESGHPLRVPEDAARDMAEGFEVLLYCLECKTTTIADSGGVLEHVQPRRPIRFTGTFY